jgi:hypothetical protein
MRRPFNLGRVQGRAMPRPLPPHPVTSSPYTMTPTPSESLPPRAAVKHHLLVMIIAIVILDAIAIPVFFLLHLNSQAGSGQNTYIGIWTLLSALVVAVQLRKIRRARLAAIRGSTPTPSNR